MSKDGTTKKWALGAIFAAIAGYVAGILTAPKSGKETREDIKETAEKDFSVAEAELKRLRVELEKVLASAKKELDKLKGQAKEDLNGAVSKANAATDKAHEILKAAKSGEADDRDLQEAINAVTEAFEHLKSYLEKK